MRVKLVTGDKKYLPEYKTCGAAGADLKSRGDWMIESGVRMKIPSGVCFEIPAGYEIQVRPRSGLSILGIDVIEGTIDSDYRGEVSVLVVNNSGETISIHDGHRIAQIVYAPVVQAEFEVSDTLSDTERGSGGFGSTGVK